MSNPNSPRDTSSTSFEDRPELSEREQDILGLVVKQFVDTAGPVGSRSLSKQFDIGLSPASIRNTMSDLEDMGYLGHPYTSAGRVPTKLGYRTFVDSLMDTPELTPAERRALTIQLASLVADTDELLRESTRLLSQLTNLLGVALTPNMSSGTLEQLDIVPLTGGRLMFVLSVSGGLVKTIVLGFESDLRRSELSRVVSILNERLAGLTLKEIRETHEERVRDIDDPTGVVQFIMDRSNPIFSEPNEARLRLGGTQNILTQPEFQEPDDVRRFIEVIEDEDRVVEWLETVFDVESDAIGQAAIKIGSEGLEDMDSYSIVTSPYSFGGTVGVLGVIGPTRMEYWRVVALVESMAAVVNRPSGDESDVPLGAEITDVESIMDQSGSLPDTSGDE
ncbi:heat-inducible transcriptional repressor HrcA [Longibacter salinarum]|uniref:heat-inducible transcriptional repressor HrcA n=1 Tax=Longibacter salinarum TaxID=1850348 RepID=UPI001FEBA3FC|nr:heat-inducible transcriptional repressor HrcA [Longibacter salinarum]